MANSVFIGWWGSVRIATDGSTTVIPGSVTLAAGTITASAPNTITQTWNSGGVTFTGASITITDTASASASRVLDILGGAAGTTELFYVRKDGTVVVGQSNVNAVGFNVSSSGATYQLLGKVLMVATAPTIASGFGTSPSIVASNGTAAFTINVGTGGTASAGVITMPAATTGWICQIQNLTAQAANRASVRTCQTASSTTSITVQNQDVATGAATAWAASDVLSITAVAY